MMIELAIYFAVGFVLDVLATVDIRAVQKKQAGLSAFMTIVGTILGTLVFIYIIKSPEFIPQVIAYAVGGGVGAFLIIKRGK